MRKFFGPVCLLFCLGFPVLPLYADSGSDLPLSDSSGENKWVPPPPVDANDRLLKFTVQADYQHDADLPDTPFVMVDMSAKRQLDENSALAEGLIRFRKPLSVSDTASSIDIRLARLSYMEPWLQLTVGRFDLFQTLTSDLFFGAYPIMGVHRVDGVMATVPFSFFFNFGPSAEGKSQTSSPLALSLFYTPSLFSAQEVQYSLTQSFWLGQLMFRVEGSGFASTFRVNLGESASNAFEYSALNGGLTGSLAANLAYQKNYALTAEYGVQNLDHPLDTGALALGFHMDRLGTWGDFSIDQVVVENQVPMGRSPENPFTGGNAFVPSLAQLPQDAWYFKIKARLKAFFIELHVTDNQNDYTFSRLMPGSTAIPFTGVFGPGNETDGPGTPLRSKAYGDWAYLARMGIDF